MFPLLEDEGVGSIPWSPLAKGRVTARSDRRAPHVPPTTLPRSTSSIGTVTATSRPEADIRSAERVSEECSHRGTRDERWTPQADQ